ncbi:MAG: Na(+)/H(+) antiporter subunit D [Desulfuromonadaceae bacterium]
MIDWLHPSFLFLIGAAVVALLPARIRMSAALLVPLAAFIVIVNLPTGNGIHYQLLGFDLTLLRVDKLSKAFGYVFTINAFAAGIFALHLRSRIEPVAALVYIGSSIGAVFAGDLISLYLFWEVMAVASTFLILARGSDRSYHSAFRYVMIHLLGGLVLLAGILLHIKSSGSVSFELFNDRGLASYLILIGFLINAAVPPMSAWLSDAYPEATVTGAVVLTAYTTKTAVYTLIRGYAGWEILMVVGCVMALYGIVYAILENDMRRILAYSIINQVGFMITGVGIGTAMALNGAVAHAFCHIIYKALLWMSAGAVLHLTGKSKCTDLGGLYKTMPLTLIFGCIGALAISSFPGFSGYTSKPMIIEAGVHSGLYWVWLTLELASAGVFLHAGIKFPYFVFFAKDSGMRPGEAPPHMLIAMAFLSFICIFLGVYPQPLYAILPFEVNFHPYTFEHTINQLQLLMFSALAFFMFLPMLKRTETISIDTDWFYRKGGKLLFSLADRFFNRLNDSAEKLFTVRLPKQLNRFFTSPAFLIQRQGLRLLSAVSSDSKKREQLEEWLDDCNRSGNYPVGVWVLLAVSLLATMSVLYLLIR